jgi:hypothetical protein
MFDNLNTNVCVSSLLSGTVTDIKLNMINMTGSTSGTETAYLFGAPLIGFVLLDR